MRVVFVSDFFVDEFIGGAELSMQTHIDSCPFEFIRVNSKNFWLDDYDKENDFFVFGNFAHIQLRFLYDLADYGWRYVVEECDYKYCQFRSKHKHEFITKQKCECEKYLGYAIERFYRNAQYLFWKSEGQREEYYRLFPSLKTVPSEIMGGVFSDADIQYILSLKNEPRSDKYFILKSNSWIKGHQNAVNYCRERNLPYTEVGNVPYRQSLRQMAGCKGIVYLPNGYDVSCRMITEAKLLGIEIITSDLVQHTKEAWFNGGEERMVEFLSSRDKKFWQIIGNLINEYSTCAA